MIHIILHLINQNWAYFVRALSKYDNGAIFD